MNNIAKPTTTITGISKPQVGETWDTCPNTWDEETRTWNASGNLITNIDKIVSTITNINKP